MSTDTIKSNVKRRIKKFASLLLLLSVCGSITFFFEFYFLFLSIPDYAGKVIYFPFFTLVDRIGISRYWNVILLLAILSPFLLNTRKTGAFLFRLWRSLKAFAKFLPHHYFLGTLFGLVVSTFIWHQSTFQMAIWFHGDYWVIIAFVIMGIMLVNRGRVRNEFGYDGINFGNSQSENPINTPDHDVIGFQDITVSIYREFEKLEDNHASFIAGVVGDYGSGKTSLLLLLRNLVIEKMNEDRSSRTRILYFDVSRYSTNPMLYSQFYHSLLSLLSEEFVIPFLTRASVVAMIAEGTGKESYLRFADMFLPRADPDKFTADITDILVRTKTKIVVLMDELDRLLNPEITEVFRLLRLIRTTKNIFVVVTCEQQRVTNQWRWATGSDDKNPNVENLLGKHFDKIFNIPGFRFSKFEKTVSEIIANTFKSILTGESYQQAMDQWNGSMLQNFHLETSRDSLLVLLRDILKTFRMIKHFQKAFQTNIKRLDVDMFIHDVVLLSALEVGAPEILQRIRTLRNDLCLLIDQNANHGRQREIARVKFEEVLKNHFPDEIDRKVVFRLFPHIKNLVINDGYTQDSSAVQSIAELMCRFAHPAVMPLYFYEISSTESIRSALSQEHRKRLLDIADNPAVNLTELADHLQALFALEDQYPAIVRNWIDREVTTNQSDVCARNIVLALSQAMKSDSSEFGFNSDGASLTIWKYLRRKGSNQQLLIDLQELDNADDFAGKAFMHAVEPIDQPIQNARLQGNMKSEMIMHFADRVARKVKKAKRIFDSSFSDVPTFFIFRWKRAEGLPEWNSVKARIGLSLEEFLCRMFRDYPKDFLCFTEMVLVDHERESDKGVRLYDKVVHDFFSDQALIDLCTFFSNEQWSEFPIWFQSAMTWRKPARTQ